MTGKTYYAIGDVHGMAGKLMELHEYIVADVAKRGGDAALVYLGDYVDRGLESRAVIQEIMRLQEAGPHGMEVIALRGNHEQMMLDAVDQVREGAEVHWLGNGGREALHSYVRRNGRPTGHWSESIDLEHVAWLRTLPTSFFDEDRQIMFVHAGIDPENFPDDKEDIRLWTRSPKFFNPARWPKRPELEDLLVVHGHTPTADLEPFVHARRINVDTGAVFGGPLTCVALGPDEEPRFLRAR